MRKLLVIPLLLIFISGYLSAQNTWHVDPSGDDAGAGTSGDPWKTWGEAFNNANVDPGDTVYFHDGIYYKNQVTEAANFRGTGFGYKITREGTEGNLVHYWAYPGETPILDCDSITVESPLNFGINASGTDYCHFKGLTIRNVWSLEDGWVEDEVVSGNILENFYYKVTVGSITYDGTPYNTNDFFTGTAVTTFTGGGTVFNMQSVECFGWKNFGAKGNIYEECTMYNIHGIGFENSTCDSSFFIECDFYDCCDSLAIFPQAPGNRGSGISVINRANITDSIFIKKSRAWLCGDQGFVSSSDAYVSWDSCWSFHNGIMEGGGHGFKLSLNKSNSSDFRRSVTNSLSIFNRQSGITTNDNTDIAPRMHVYNNTVYHNGYYPDNEWWGSGGLQFQDGIIIYDSDSDASVELDRIFRNNISYDNEGENDINVRPGASYTHSNNDWDTGVTVTNSDFIGPLDSTTMVAGLKAARGSDGSLPAFIYLDLADGSDLIDAGVDVGIPFNGSAPDIGYNESEPPLPPPAEGYILTGGGTRLVVGSSFIVGE